MVGALVRSVEVADQIRASNLPELRRLILREIVVEDLAVEVLDLTLDGRSRSLGLWLRSIIGRGERPGTFGGHHWRHHLVLRSLRRHHIAHHTAIVVAVLGLRAH